MNGTAPGSLTTYFTFKFRGLCMGQASGIQGSAGNDSVVSSAQLEFKQQMELKKCMQDLAFALLFCKPDLEEAISAYPRQNLGGDKDYWTAVTGAVKQFVPGAQKDVPIDGSVLEVADSLRSKLRELIPCQSELLTQIEKKITAMQNSKVPWIGPAFIDLTNNYAVRGTEGAIYDSTMGAATSLLRTLEKLSAPSAESPQSSGFDEVELDHEDTPIKSLNTPLLQDTRINQHVGQNSQNALESLKTCLSNYCTTLRISPTGFSRVLETPQQQLARGVVNGAKRGIESVLPKA